MSCCPKLCSSGILGSSDGKMEEDMDMWLRVEFEVMQALYHAIEVKKESKVEFLNYLFLLNIFLCSDQRLWSQVLVSDRKDKVADAKG